MEMLTTTSKYITIMAIQGNVSGLYSLVIQTQKNFNINIILVNSMIFAFTADKQLGKKFHFNKHKIKILLILK